MIEHEFTDISKLQADIQQRSGTIIHYDNAPSLKLGWKLFESDEIWTIHVRHLMKNNNKIRKIKYVCC